MPTSIAIFWPVIVQVLLVHTIYIVMVRRRYAAVRAGAAQARDFKIPTVEPEPSATAARNLINQFELPVLFYLVCTLLYVSQGVGWPAVVLAWLFSISRAAHAFVHVTSNRLMLRQRLFITGMVLEVMLWLVFAAHLLTM